MDIRTTRRETGRAIRDEILRRYGDREGAVRAARDEDHGDAHDATFWLDLFDQDPSLLDQEMTTTTLWELEPHEIRLFTGLRLELLQKIVDLDKASISELRRAVDRDYKRVQNDVDILERLGAVRTHREGRRRIVEAEGTALTIHFA